MNFRIGGEIPAPVTHNNMEITAMAKISDSVCLNHPDVQAVTRCAACGKPICNDCIVHENGSNYCSSACANNAKKSSVRVDEVMESRNRVESKKRIKKFVVMIIVIILAATACYFYTRNKDDVNQYLKEKRKTLGREIERNASGIKKDIGSGVPTTSKYKASRESMLE